MKKEMIRKCNGCGKTLASENGELREDALLVEWNWGYFSGKDGETHAFCLCESCYDAVTAQFALPVTVKEYL